MNQVLKLQSNNNAPFISTTIEYTNVPIAPLTTITSNTQNNLVNIDIPDDGQYDLSESYVNLYLELRTTDHNTPDNPGIYTFKAVANEKVLYDTDTVKNAKLYTQNSGRIEDLRNVNVFRHNIQQLTTSTSEKLGRQYYSVNQMHDNYSQLLSPFVYYASNKQLNQSKYMNAPIRVMLKDLFNIGQMTHYPADLLGVSRLTLELSPNILESFMPVFNAITVEVEDVSGVVDVSELTTKRIFNNVHDIPFYVGQKIHVSGTAGGGGLEFNNYPTIEDVNWITDPTNPDYKKVVLTITNLNTAANWDSVDNRVSDAVPASLTTTITMAEVVLTKQAVPVAQKAVEYRTFSTEVYTANNVKALQRLFYLEPNCVNVYIMFPETNSLYSRINNNETIFRLRLDNEDLTDRSVKVISPLYFDRISMTLMNSGMQLKSLVASGDPNIVDEVNKYNDGTKMTLICNPIPLTVNEKQLLLDMTVPQGSGNIGTVMLFKELVETLEF